MSISPDAIVISLNDVSELTSLSRTSINRERSTGTFPKEVILGERRIGFVRTEVVEWLEERIERRFDGLNGR